MPKPKPTQGSTHTCQQCGKQWTRYHNLGKPKWCSQRCADLGKFGAHRVCERCKEPYFGVGKKYCSRDCYGSGSGGRSGVAAIRHAHDDRDWDRLLLLLRECAEVQADGCWSWLAAIDRWGYPVVRSGKKNLRGNRLALEAKHRALLGSQSAHHMCANTLCVNPDHLQPVTHAENTAEMLARRSYVARICELEAALALADPSHPLLTATIPVA